MTTPVMPEQQQAAPIASTDRSVIVPLIIRGEIIQSDLVTFRALERYSIGWERLPANEGRPGLNRVPLRLGFTLLRWPDLLPVAGASDIQGGVAAVEEWTASIGSGLRTKDGGGAIDVSLEGGQRGDKDRLGAMETFFRLGLSLRVSDETWR